MKFWNGAGQNGKTCIGDIVELESECIRGLL